MRKPWFRASKSTWYVTLEDGNRVSLGVRGEENEADAFKAWHRLEADGRQEKERKTAGATVREVIEAFLADAKNRLSKGALRNYTDFLTPFATRFGSIKATALTTEQAEKYARKPSWGSTYRHDFLTTLASAFRWAEQSARINGNPLRHLRKPPRSIQKGNTLITPDEHALLLQHAPAFFKPFLIVLHATGARPSEVSGITAETFDENAGVVRLREHKTASKGKSRTLFLTKDAMAVLRQLKATYGSGLLLRNSRGLKWTKNAIILAFKRLRRLTSINHITAYGYRHTFATDALAKGVPDAQVAELMGHSGTAMLHRHYAHLGAKARELKNALGKVR